MQKIKQTIKNTVMGILVLTLGVLASTSLPSTVHAAGNNNCGVDTAVLKCTGSGGSGDQGEAIWAVLLMAVNVLIAGVGVLALGGIIYGAILYSSAGGSPEQVKKAKGIFTNVVIGIVAFGGMYALLNFLVPGGAFN